MRHILFILLSCTLLIGGASAAEPSTAAKVKVAMLYNILKFVEWPVPSALERSSLTIAVIGDNEFVTLVSSLDGKRLGERSIRVVSLSKKDLASTQAPDVLCLDLSSPQNMTQVLATYGGVAVLTVSDRPGFAEVGGMIEFAEVEAKVRFDINLDAATQARLRFSSKLAGLSRNVIKDGITRTFR